MKIEENENEIKVTVEKPTEVAVEIADAICQVMRRYQVNPNYIFPVLTEGIVRFLAPVAQQLGFDEQSAIRYLGKGLTTCELEMKTKGN